MVRANEFQVRRALMALQALTNPTTLRTQNGRRVADIVPSARGDWSLIRELARMLDVSDGTASTYISVLIRSGLLQPGQGRRRMRRWVVMDGQD